MASQEYGEDVRDLYKLALRMKGTIENLVLGIGKGSTAAAQDEAVAVLSDFAKWTQHQASKEVSLLGSE